MNKCLLIVLILWSTLFSYNNSCAQSITKTYYNKLDSIDLGINSFKQGNDSLAISYLKPLLQDSTQLDSQELTKVKLALQLYYANHNLSDYNLLETESLIKQYNNEDSLKIASLHRISYDLIDLNKNNEAISYINDALAINNIESTIYYVPLLLDQAHAHEMLGQNQRVIETYGKILNSKNIKEDYYYVATLQNAARFYSRIEDTKKAIKYIKQAIKATDKSNYDKYAELLSDLARFYVDANNIKKSIEIQENVIDVRKRNICNHDDKSKLVISLSNLINYYEHNNDSINSFNTKHELIDSNYPVNSRRTYFYAYDLSYHYYEKGDIEKAVHYGIKAVELIESNKEEYLDDYISLVCYLRDIYVEIKDYEQAIIYQKKYINTFTSKDSEYATAVALLAQYYNSKSEIEEDKNIAIELLEEAITIRGEVDGKTSDPYLRSKMNIGKIRLGLNRYNESIKDFEYVFQNVNDNYSHYNLVLEFLAEAYHRNGNNSKAVEVIEKLQSLSLSKNDSISYIKATFNLAQYDVNIENYTKHLNECLSIIEKIKNNKRLYIDGLTSIGELYLKLRIHKEAIKYNQKALNLEEKYFGKSSNYVAYSTRLFASFINAERYNEADSLAKITLPIAQKNSYIKYVEILNNYSVVLSRLERYKEAIECEKEVVDIFKSLHGTNSSLYATACHNLAWDLYHVKEYNQAIEYFKIALNIRKKNYHNNPLDYISSLEGIVSSCIKEDIDCSHYIKEHVDLNKELLSNGVVSMTEEQRFNFLYEYLKGKSLNYYLYNVIKDSEYLYNYRIFFKDILLNFYNLKDDKIKPFDWKEVQQNLSQNEIAIEFLCYQLFDQTNVWAYDALLLKKGWDKPILVNLFTNSLNDETDLDNLVYKINELWKPIMEFIKPNDNVYFSLDDILNWFPVESLLVINNNDFIMSDLYNMYRVSSTKEIINIKNNKPQYTNIALYGGLNYDISNEEMISESRKYSQIEPHNQLFVSRGLSLDSIRGYKWNKLDNSLYEVDYIEELLKGNHILTKKYVRNSGNEESFKSLSGKNVDIIHLATHGFYIENKEDLDNKKYYNNKFDRYNQYDDNIEISMLNTGLILSGGNRAWQGKEIPSSIEDGILLAKEISHMDLNNTDLVVLSACDGGAVGSNYLGNFGLSYSFKLAGVQSLIMNLTEVDDQTASIMMKQFYTNLMAGQSKHKAFYNAQRYIRKIKPEYKYWFGWIMLD